MAVSKEGELLINKQPATDNVSATAVIAYFNTAVEAEYLGQWHEAKEYYENAMKIVLFEDKANMKEKIMKALQHVNMKVRNKVQLEPEKPQHRLNYIRRDSFNNRILSRKSHAFVISPKSKSPSHDSSIWTQRRPTADLTLKQLVNQLETVQH